jgi:hypothetical protein
MHMSVMSPTAKEKRIMATNAATKTPAAGASTERTTRERKPAPALHERMKNQLTNAALRGKIEEKDLEQLEAHIGKLKNLLAV